jgi:hypothetical protein
MLAVLGLGFDCDARAGQPASVEPFLQLVGQRLGHERGVVDTLGGRIELGRDGEVGRDGPLVEQPSVVTVRESMGQGAERTEARRDIGRRQRRASRACGPRVGQQVDEIVEAELGLDHRNTVVGKGEELGGATCGIREPERLAQRAASSAANALSATPTTGGPATSTRWPSTSAASATTRSINVVSAEVAEGPRVANDVPGRVISMCEHVERPRAARTRGHCGRISGNDVETRATPLCFTTTQPRRHPRTGRPATMR